MLWVLVLGLLIGVRLVRLRPVQHGLFHQEPPAARQRPSRGHPAKRDLDPSRDLGAFFMNHLKAMGVGWSAHVGGQFSFF